MSDWSSPEAERLADDAQLGQVTDRIPGLGFWLVVGVAFSLGVAALGVGIWWVLERLAA